MYDEAFDICMNDMDSEEEWSSLDNKVTQVAPITDFFFLFPFLDGINKHSMLYRQSLSG